MKLVSEIRSKVTVHQNPVSDLNFPVLTLNFLMSESLKLVSALNFQMSERKKLVSESLKQMSDFMVFPENWGISTHAPCVFIL